MLYSKREKTGPKNCPMVQQWMYATVRYVVQKMTLMPQALQTPSNSATVKE